MEKPSIALLTAIHGEKVIFVDDEPIKNDVLRFLFLNRCYTNSTAEFMSIYKLTDLMKTWLLTLDYEIDMAISTHSVGAELIGECDCDEFGCLKFSATKDSEYEAVLALAEWALKEIK